MNLVSVRSSFYGSSDVIKNVLTTLKLTNFENPCDQCEIDDEKLSAYVSDRYLEMNGFVVVGDQTAFGTIPKETVEFDQACEFMEESLDFDYSSIFEFISDGRSIFYGVFPGVGVYLLGISVMEGDKYFVNEMMTTFIQLSNHKVENRITH